jgi:SAM-dependent methyltransferase
VLVQNPGEYVTRMQDAALWREDLPTPLVRWLLAQLPENHDPGWRRQMLAVYGTTLRPPRETDDPFQRSLNDQILRTREFLDERQAGAISERDACRVADLGCGVGASSLALAGSGARVFAVDHDFAALRVLSHLIHTGQTEVPVWRHGGADYTTSRVRVATDSQAANILPIAADALAPPFGVEAFDLVTCYNLLDNVAEPLVLLRQIFAVLRPGGRLHLMSPYDWASRCTPREQQLGGGIGGAAERDPAVVLRSLLEGRYPEVAAELRFRVEHEREALPWILHRHARSYHVFLCHYIEAVAEK